MFAEHRTTHNTGKEEPTCFLFHFILQHLKKHKQLHIKLNVWWESHNQESNNSYFQHYNYSYSSGYFKFQYKCQLLNGITGILSFFCGAAVAAGVSFFAAGASLLFVGVTLLEVSSFADPDSDVCSLFDLSGENHKENQQIMSVIKPVKSNHCSQLPFLLQFHWLFNWKWKNNFSFISQ